MSPSSDRRSERTMQPRTSTSPSTVDTRRLDGRPSTLTSPSDVDTSTATPGGTVTSKSALQTTLPRVSWPPHESRTVSTPVWRIRVAWTVVPLTTRRRSTTSTERPVATWTSPPRRTSSTIRRTLPTGYSYVLVVCLKWKASCQSPNAASPTTSTTAEPSTSRTRHEARGVEEDTCAPYNPRFARPIRLAGGPRCG